MTQIYIVGFSHITAYIQALAQGLEVFDPPIKFVDMRLYTSRGGPDTVPLRNGELHPALLRALEPENADRITFSTVGGNAHHFMSLFEHPKPFDFILPENPDLPLAEDVQVLPFDFVLHNLGGLARSYLEILSAVRASVTGPMVQIESPPPIGDNAYVADKLGPYFIDIGRGRAVASPTLRYKAWRLNAFLEKHLCDKNNIDFLTGPAEGADSEGFLRPEGYRDDPSHGNAWYGAAVLRKIKAHAAMIADGAR